MDARLLGDLLALVVTVVLSIGGALFVSGRTLGSWSGQIAQNKKDIKELRDDFEKCLNDGIRKDIKEINEKIAVITTDLGHCKTNVAKVGGMSEDIAYMRGQLETMGHKPRKGKAKGDG